MHAAGGPGVESPLTLFVAFAALVLAFFFGVSPLDFSAAALLRPCPAVSE